MIDPSDFSDPERLQPSPLQALVDDLPDEDFDRLAKLAARLLDVPAAFVTLVDDKPRHDDNVVSISAAGSQRRPATSIGSDRSVCLKAVITGQPFVIDDARIHPLMKDNFVGADSVIAYLGVPVESPSGEVIGALCVVDSKPRSWTVDDIENLRTLARSASKLVAESHDQDPPEDGGADDDRTGRRLVQCITEHLDSAEAYTRLLKRQGRIDLAVEGAARSVLIRSTGRTRAFFEREEASFMRSIPDLARVVRDYLDADHNRERLASGFRAGEAKLSDLEAAIAGHIDAVDALRASIVRHAEDL